MSLLPSPPLRPVALLTAVALCGPSILATGSGAMAVPDLATRFLLAFAVAAVGIGLVERLVAGYAHGNDLARLEAERTVREAERAVAAEARTAERRANADASASAGAGAT